MGPLVEKVKAEKHSGRPRLGQQPLTANERKRRSLAGRLKDGGSVLSLTLSADETEALASGMEKTGSTVKRAYVAGLIKKNR